jgi:hypothetical protein
MHYLIIDVSFFWLIIYSYHEYSFFSVETLVLRPGVTYNRPIHLPLAPRSGYIWHYGLRFECGPERHHYGNSQIWLNYFPNFQQYYLFKFKINKIKL